MCCLFILVRVFNVLVCLWFCLMNCWCVFVWSRWWIVLVRCWLNWRVLRFCVVFVWCSCVC